MASATSARIVTELHDEPHIEGRRVTVRRIQGLVEGAGNSPVDVADEFDLDPADVYAALHYYHTHPEEMAQAEQRQQRRERDAKEADAKSVADYEDSGGNDVASDPR